jgi:methyl-accepting chemotaxis protein
LNAAVEAARAGAGAASPWSPAKARWRSAALPPPGNQGADRRFGDKVQAGNRLVEQAGATMNEVVSSVKRVTDIMSEIMMASQEQSAGIEQINNAVTQMDDVTQQNAALVEEAAAAAQAMQDQVNSLNLVVEHLPAGRYGQPVSGAAAHRPQSQCSAWRTAAPALTTTPPSESPLRWPPRRPTASATLFPPLPNTIVKNG